MAQGYWSMFHDTCFPFWYFKVHKSLDLDEEGVLRFTGLKTYQHDLPWQFDLSTGCSEQSFVLNSCMFALLQTLLCTVPDPCNWTSCLPAKLPATASATRAARGDGETDEINFCFVRVFPPVAQPRVFLMTDCEMGYTCAFFPRRLGRGQRAFGVVPVRPSAGKSADIRALHLTGAQRRMRRMPQWGQRRSWVCIDHIRWVREWHLLSIQR